MEIAIKKSSLLVAVHFIFVNLILISLLVEYYIAIKRIDSLRTSSVLVYKTISHKLADDQMNIRMSL